jgi:hypothetical protein
MSSLSMNKVRGRALNANTQNTNNYSMWMEPLSHKDYPVTYVANPTQNAVITSNGVKNVVVAQPGMLYNQARLDVSGSVNPTRWTTGQTINTVFLEAQDISNLNILVSRGIHQVASYTYTPMSNNSKIIVEYGAIYDISGWNGDSFESRIEIDNSLNIIGKRYQKFVDYSGGGTRSSTIFPICGAYTNNAFTPRKIMIMLTNDSDDPVRLYGASFDASMKITEISR